jgi:superfamily II DNA/RNA helicase
MAPALVPAAAAKPASDDDDDDDDDEDDEDDEDDKDDEGSSGMALFSGTAASSSSSSAAPSRPRGAGAPSAAPSSSSAPSSADPEDPIRAFRKRMGIRVVGSGVPRPYASFEELPSALPADAAEEVAAWWRGDGDAGADGEEDGAAASPAARVQARHAHVRSVLLRNIEASAYTEPTPVQMQCVPSVAEGGRDVLASAPTGSGKTAAFLLPLLVRLQGHVRGGPRVLILVPTKELAAQTQREADRLGSGLGIRTSILTKSVAEGAMGGGRISAAVDAPELARQTTKQKRKLERKRLQTEGKAAGAVDVEEGEEEEDDDVVDVDEEDEGKLTRHRPTVTKATADRRGGGKKEEEEEEEEEDDDDVLHWTDDEDLDDSPPPPPPSSKGGKGKKGPAAAAAGSRASSAASSSSSLGALAVPRLPQCDILVATPLILIAVLRHAKATATAAAATAAATSAEVRAALPSLRALVLDEADKLLELGFVAQVDEIMDAARARARPPPPSPSSPPSPPPAPLLCGMYTATLPSGVQELALSVLRDPVQVHIGLRGATASAVTQRLVFVGSEEGKAYALRDLLARGVRPPVLVFVQSKERAEQVFKALTLEGVSAEVIHSDRGDKERERAVSRFRRGEASFLVATDLLGRGLDFKGVNMVLNFDFPQSGVSYVHRVGRTGRAGRAGEAVTFFTEEDIPSLRSIANVMRISGCDVPEWMLTLKKMGRQDRKKLERHAPRRGYVGPVTVRDGGGRGKGRGEGEWGGGGRGGKRRKTGHGDGGKRR